ncbi:MAG: hypothetical protein V1650_02735 [Candidatus Omnitrophota bacterium]
MGANKVKKKWHVPQLIVLLGPKTDELVLTGCKTTDRLAGYPGGVDNQCIGNVSACTNCYYSGS